MTLTDLSPLANHIWQSTVLVVVAWFLTLVLRKNRASVRYWVWFAASVKFLIPFSVLISIGSRFAWRSSPVIAPPQFANVIDEIGQPFATFTNVSTPAVLPHASSVLPLSLLAVWLCGGMVVLIFWLRTLGQVRAIKRAATPLPLGLLIPVMSSAARMEPGVFGIFNPVLILPEGIMDRLTPAQFKAVLAHELCHVRRRDNLTAAIHMVVEVIFWFYPLVWWIRTQLVAERESACDEAVIRTADNPQVYAEAILNVCKLYMESPLRCVSGVSGSDLKRRIRLIVTGRVGGELTLARRAVLATAGMAALVVPISMGLMGAPSIRAQSQAQGTVAIGPEFKYEVASIKPNNSGPGGSRDRATPDGFTATNTSLMALLLSAYEVQSYRIVGAPSWANADRYDVNAKMEGSVADALQKLNQDERTIARQQMMEALLVARFNLKTHRESKDLPVYTLVIAKNGSKLQEAKTDESPSTVPGRGGFGRGGMTLTMEVKGGARLQVLTGKAIPIASLIRMLAGALDRPVLDKTGLTGLYDVKLEWSPDDGQIQAAPGGAPSGQTSTPPPDPTGPDLFAAVQGQLGLKLESGKGPVEIVVIDHVERPSGN